MPSNRRSRGARASGELLPPNPTPSPLVDRDKWIDDAAAGFVTRSAANRAIYRSILEVLWPVGHGIPGPVLTREELRQAVEENRGFTYRDPFRRVRELQGEEGFLGIIKSGQRYQLINLNIGPKKTPRVSLSARQWELVLQQYGNVCAVCGCGPDDDGFQQDHKVPRQHGGDDALTNWQPLCDRCNGDKSVACRGCTKDCSTCGWAYPEYYRPLRIASTTIRRMNDFAERIGGDSSALATQWLEDRLTIEYQERGL